MREENQGCCLSLAQDRGLLAFEETYACCNKSSVGKYGLYRASFIAGKNVLPPKKSRIHEDVPYLLALYHAKLGLLPQAIMRTVYN